MYSLFLSRLNLNILPRHSSILKANIFADLINLFSMQTNVAMKGKLWTYQEGVLNAIWYLLIYKSTIFKLTQLVYITFSLKMHLPANMVCKRNGVIIGQIVIDELDAIETKLLNQRDLIAWNQYNCVKSYKWKRPVSEGIKFFQQTQIFEFLYIRNLMV